jgi:hypothetical protein
VTYWEVVGVKGPAKKKVGDPRGGWVDQYEKGMGSNYIFRIFYRVFELPSPRNAQKRDKRKSKRNRFFWIFGRIFCVFSTRCFLQNVFFCIFELPSLRNPTPENAIKQKCRGKTNTEIFVDFFGKSFRHGLFAKICLWCF